MAFHKLTPRERDLYRRAKIVGYYQAKNESKRKESSTRYRYGNFDIDASFKRALERSQKEIDRVNKTR